MSELDLQIAASVPPGGNWKNIPLSVPSKRLEQIRVSFAAGEGSRSTYYGRLRADRPAYTVNTYYNRPGNGCFLHYDFAGGQHRTISHREAARLQTFPDSFIFLGPQRAVCQQIGNAVPPLLAYQIAMSLGAPGAMIDLFSGAGGLTLGFDWAGWKSLTGVDLDAHSVETFNANVAPVAFVGDLNDSNVHERITQVAGKRKQRLALVGGPPCQGFSTGGKRRSTEDDRNLLYRRYLDLLRALRPDVFVFENVTGLLNLDRGAFLANLMNEFSEANYQVALWRLNAAMYGVPQRRQRVLIVGVPAGERLPQAPPEWTSVNEGASLLLPPVCCSFDALHDLPPLKAGQDGSELPYTIAPANHFQSLMRGALSPGEYFALEQRRNDPAGQQNSVRRIA